MSDFRIDVKIKNYRLITAIEENHVNVNRFSKEFDLDPVMIGNFVNMKRSPLSLKDRDWLPSAKQIAECLGVLPEELWPDHMQELVLATNSASAAMTAWQVTQFLEMNSPLQLASNAQSAEIFENLLKTLSVREEEILVKRYGLNGHKETTFTEISKLMNLSAPRVLQLHNKALRKLRHSSRVKFLDSMLDEVVDA